MAKKAAKPKSKKPAARRKPKAKGEQVQQGETNSVLDGAMKSVIRNAFLNRAG
ncbi:MAG: hypothetical protein OXH94_02225 [Rhodospirillales bacterium]|nr:hypothetical protein [Rhodospirillales bacterium]